mgnify:CR=1 FL=1
MIQTEVTPNPESLKFLSENVISTIGTEEFQKTDVKKIEKPFIRELLNFKGVELVLLSKNFLSVKKTPDVSWNELKPMVISHLNHYFENNKRPILEEINKEKDKLEKLLQVNGGKYKTIKHLEIRIRNGLENMRVQTTNNKHRVINHIKQQCVFFIRASWKNPKRFKKFPYFSIAFKKFITLL